MIKEVIAEGTTISIAIENGVNEIGVDKDLCSIEILETPKRTLFGRSRKAVVKVTTEIIEDVSQDISQESNHISLEENTTNIVEETSVAEVEDIIVTKEEVSITKEEVITPCEDDNKVFVDETEEKSTLVISDLRNGTKTNLAIAYLTEILKSMKLEHITMSVQENEDNANITFDGEGMAVLIGHHGETLDALQYLTTLTCNRDDGDYYRISLDCGNYRQKREVTLQNLASRVGAKVKRTGRSQLLEPMSSYERKVIHAVIADMEGVHSKSKGEEPNRKVIILSNTPYNNKKNHSAKVDD